MVSLLPQESPGEDDGFVPCCGQWLHLPGETFFFQAHSSWKLWAGEYALVINGHSLVSVATLSLGRIFSESGYYILPLFPFPDFAGAVVLKELIPRSLLEHMEFAQCSLCSRPTLLEADMELEFLETACACKAVICCRGDSLAEGTGGGTGEEVQEGCDPWPSGMEPITLHDQK